MPAGSLQRQARGERAIDVGEFIRFNVARGLAGTNKGPQLRSDLLLDAQAGAGSAAIAANRGNVHGSPGALRLLHRLIEKPHAPAALEYGHQPPAGPLAELMAMLEFQVGLELMKPGI